MQIIIPIGCVVLGTVFFCVLVYSALNKKKLKRVVQNMPTSKIGFLKNGFVRVCGTVVANDKVLKSPYSKKDCVYYRFVLEEYVKIQKEGMWETRVRDEKGVGFSVEDSTGKAKIDMQGAQISFKQDTEFHTGALDSPLTNEVKDLLINNYKVHIGKKLDCTNNLRVNETYLEPGDEVFVLGHAKKGIDETLIYKENMLYVSDRSEKGVLSSLKMNYYSDLIFAVISFGVAVFVFLKFVLPAIN